LFPRNGLEKCPACYGGVTVVSVKRERGGGGVGREGGSRALRTPDGDWHCGRRQGARVFLHLHSHAANGNDGGNHDFWGPSTVRGQGERGRASARAATFFRGTIPVRVARSLVAQSVCGVVPRPESARAALVPRAKMPCSRTQLRPHTRSSSRSSALRGGRRERRREMERERERERLR
jgi:hypothetical protein